MSVTVKAFAKINLYLDVVGKRANGYHDIVSVMQAVSLCDTLTVARTKEGISLDTGGVLPADDSNLIVRAAKRYFAVRGNSCEESFGVHITLSKHIPMAAGLGGGSADAAATLKALNVLDGERFTAQELAELGTAIGADVPFCVLGGTALCEGIGEVLTPLQNRLRATLVLAVDGEGVSTPTAFAALDARYGDFRDFVSEVSPRPLIGALEKGDFFNTVSALFNRFEEAVEPTRPAVTELKHILRDYGAAAVQMSGSGPTVFGLFENENDAKRAENRLKNAGVRAYMCQML